MKHIKHLLFLSILCSLVLFTNCGEEGEDPVADDTTDTTGDTNTDDTNTDDLSENILGKWDVSNNSTNPFERDDVILFSFIFNSNQRFIINYSDGTLEGNYSIDSETEVTLENIGKLENISINEGALTSDLSLDNVLEKSVESNRDYGFIEGDCSTFLECMDGKVFGDDGRFIKVKQNLELVVSSFIDYSFGKRNSCCHYEEIYNNHSLTSYDNIEVDVFEHTQNHISLYYETNCCDDFIIRYRIDEFGNFVDETLQENDNEYRMGYSRKETTQTVLDDMLQEYGGNVICEPIDESTSFIDKQNGKYYKYSFDDYNWYFRFTDNEDEYFTLYHNLNDISCYNFFNKTNNNLGFDFYDTSQYPFQTIDNFTRLEFFGCPNMDNSLCLTTVFSLFMNSCGELYVDDNSSEPSLNDSNGPMKYITGFEYWNNNSIDIDYSPWIIFDEISQTNFETEVLGNICE